jgi:hypothetical protein
MTMGSRRLWEVKVCRFRDMAFEGGWLSTLRTGRLYPRSMLVLILRGRVDLGHTELLDATEKIPSDTTGD